MKLKFEISFVLFFSLLALALVSCLPEETPIKPPVTSPEVETVDINMGGSDYDQQVYFDLGTAAVVGTSNRMIWDLAFETGNSDFYIWLNGAKGNLVWNTGVTDFQAVTSKSGASWIWDMEDGMPDSNAIGAWGDFNLSDPSSYGFVYILKIPEELEGQTFDYKKFQLLDFYGGNYQLRVADLDGGNEMTISVPKDDNYNFAYLSMMDGDLKSVEPLKDSWDFVFTKYWTTFYDPAFLGYHVTGTLINPSQVMVAIDSLTPFDSIELADISAYTFSQDWDAIGYDWKYFDLDNNQYTVLYDRNYIIQDYAGDFYKLRFTSFVNATGELGYPTFDLQMLD